MNAELQRQHEAHKERQARMARGGRPMCRGIVSEAVRGPILDARREISVDQARRQHDVRVQCIREYFERERQGVRAVVGEVIEQGYDALRAITWLEHDALLGELELYEMDLQDARA